MSTGDVETALDMVPDSGEDRGDAGKETRLHVMTVEGAAGVQRAVGRRNVGEGWLGGGTWASLS